jgi:hypothetical protein
LVITNRSSEEVGRVLPASQLDVPDIIS